MGLLWRAALAPQISWDCWRLLWELHLSSTSSSIQSYFLPHHSTVEDPKDIVNEYLACQTAFQCLCLRVQSVIAAIHENFSRSTVQDRLFRGHHYVQIPTSKAKKKRSLTLFIYFTNCNSYAWLYSSVQNSVSKLYLSENQIQKVKFCFDWPCAQIE